MYTLSKAEGYIRRLGSAAAAAAVVLLLPAAAAAQALSIGPRMSFVKPDPAIGTASDRYTGGVMRLKVSPRTSIELAMDWRSTTSEDATVRIHDYPFQGSLVVYPLRASLSPYLVGGIGWYSQRMEALDGAAVLSEQTVRRRGYHGGIGGELKLGSRASLFADYRYTFIRFGGEEETTVENGAGAFAIPGFSSLTEYFKLSHEGSMWTAGLTVNF